MTRLPAAARRRWAQALLAVAAGCAGAEASTLAAVTAVAAPVAVDGTVDRAVDGIGDRTADSVVGAAVVSVATAGYWQADGRAGRYRVVVSQHGFEHVSSRVRVEWLAEPASAGDGPSVLAGADVELPQDGLSLAVQGVTAAGTGCARVQLAGVQAALPQRRVSYTLWATAPGQLLLQQASSTSTSAQRRADVGRPPAGCRRPAGR